MLQNPPFVEILGLTLHPVKETDLYDSIADAVAHKTKTLIFYLNIHGITLALNDHRLFDIFNSAQLVFCDGEGVRWGCKMLGETPPPKIPVTRWIWDLAGFCEKKRYRLFLLGTKPEIIEQAARHLKSRFPGAEIAGTHHGYFNPNDKAENENVIRKINETKPDLLIAGLGTPFQEKWLYDNSPRLHASVFLSGGAVFDYVAGRLGNVPSWMIKAHLEWFFRVWQEPGRLFMRYAYDIPYFFCRVFAEKQKRLFRANPE